MKNFYITTTLPYSNGKPHIGHTLEFIQADVIARYQRKKRGAEHVWYNLGLDEHGLKMFQKAKELGQTPEEYADEWAEKWKEFCELFNISYDTFYRTSDPSHHKKAQEWWKKADQNGDIYKKEYTGLYCVGCEEFKTEKDLVDGKCPDHGKEPIEISEENYFFRLSRYKEHLLHWLDSNPEILKQKSKLPEIKNWISNMEDISVSRVKEKLPWGIEVPGDPTQVMYVWFDALTDYINVLDEPEAFKIQNSKFKKDVGLSNWWPGIQLFGPDNLRFQVGIWQGMLASFGLPQTKKFLNHGMVLAADGTKMSKSKGNGVDPMEQQEKYGVEALRYYLITGIATYADSPYKEEELVNLYNANLANNFGNLLNRVIHLVNTKKIDLNAHDAVSVEFKEKVDKEKETIQSLLDGYELQEASLQINKLANFGNEYITEEQPWEKSVSDQHAADVLANLGFLLSAIIDLYEPIIPEACARAKHMLEKQEKGVLFEKLVI